MSVKKKKFSAFVTKVFVLQFLPPDRNLKRNAFPECGLFQIPKEINKMQCLVKSNCLTVSAFLEWSII